MAWVVLRKASQRFENVFQLKPWDPLRFLECDAEPVAEAFGPRNDGQCWPETDAHASSHTRIGIARRMIYLPSTRV